MGLAESLGDALSSFLPPWAVVTLISLMPFIEMRGAVPIAVLVYHWDLGLALAFCGAVSIVPGFAIVFYLERLEPGLRKVRLFDRTLDRAFAWTRKKNADPAEKAKRDRRATLLLALLVAVPGPGTGAWTGGLVSYVFEVPKRRAAAALTLGVVGEAAAIAALVLLFQWSVGALP
ncbi:MAG TPA: small multi-drug export protein [Candidatus Thermoplasmatota archaeon]|nr:small multi-drug export protein [Candidatus Thermoplasmatota archaeon]